MCIQCIVPTGVGNNKYVRITVDGQVNDPSSPNSVFSYLPPVVEYMSAQSANTGPELDGVPTVVNITGRNFGSTVNQAAAAYAAGGTLTTDVTRYV